MAKKNTMNLFEAHIEKVFLILAIGFFGWVVFSRFVSSSTISTNDGTSIRKISELAEKGTAKAQEILANMKRDGTSPDTVFEQSVDIFGVVPVLKLADAGGLARSHHAGRETR